MRKRYAFFRKPDGKPCRGNDEKYAPCHMLATIGRGSKLGDAGGVQWSRTPILEIETALKSAVVIIDPDDRELNEIDTSTMIWAAISAIAQAAPGTPIRPTVLLEEADRRAAEFFRRPEEQYVLVSSLSLDALPADPIEVRGCVISCLPGRGAFPLPERVLSRARETPIATHLASSKYLVVKVDTSGKSKHEAVEKAFAALNLLRGIWSLFATYRGHGMRFGWMSQVPLGIIHNGPLQTLHTPDGKSVDNDCWFDPDFMGDRPLFNSRGSWPVIEEKRQFVMGQLAVLKYRLDLPALRSLRWLTYPLPRRELGQAENRG